FKKVISRRNIRRRITIPLTLSNLKLLRRITRTENILHRNLRLLRVSGRSEERFSRNAETDLVCRLLLEKKNDLANDCSTRPCLHPFAYLTYSFRFFVQQTRGTSIYTLSLHDALPISSRR